MESDSIKDGIVFVDSPESVGISSRHIANYLNRLREINYDLHSFQIVKDGKLIFANAAQPYRLKDWHRLLSAAKPIIAATVLFAIDEGALTFESRIIDFFQDKLPQTYDRRFESITVYDLLTMQSGQNSDEAFLQYIDHPEIDLCKSFFAGKMDCEPGTHFFYNNAIPHLLFFLVERSTGIDIETYIHDRIGAPLGMDIIAQYDKDHVYNPVTTVVSSDGFLKLALWFLQQGAWNGKQLLDPALVKAACTQQTWTGVDEAGYHNGKGYCMQLWKNAFGGCRMDGGGGQYALILPEQNMAVVIMSNDFRGDMAISLFYDEILSKIHGKALAGCDQETALFLETAKYHMSRAPLRTVPHSKKGEANAQKLFCFPPNPWKIESVCLSFHGEVVFLGVEQDGEKRDYEIGLGGKWCENKKALILEPDISIQNCIYGSDPQICSLSGGWENENDFVVVSKSIASMGEYIFKFQFGEATLELWIPNGVTGGMKPEKGSSCIASIV